MWDFLIEQRYGNSTRQKLNERMKVCTAAITQSLIGPGFSQTVAQAGVTHGNPLASSSSTTSTLSVVTTSKATAVSVASNPQQLPLPSSQAVASVAAASVASASPLFFSKDVEPEPDICRLPGPGELLKTTRQLAYCLALLQPSVQEDNLSEDDFKWRHSTLNNPAEKDRLETLSVQIVKEFIMDSIKNAALVAEVVQLAPVLNSEYSRSLLKNFIDTVDESEILHWHSLDGLAKVIQGAAPGSIDLDDLETILRSLHKRLRPTHSTHNQYRLLLATSRGLDAMTDANIGDIDHVDLHEPLTDFLGESESKENPYLAFQAAYATQALLNISDDEDIWHAGFRRLWIVLKSGAGFAKTPDLTEVKDALDYLEGLYEVGKGGARMLKEALMSIKNRESPTFTVKEGLKFKRAWYRALRTAESYIQTGRLAQFRGSGHYFALPTPVHVSVGDLLVARTFCD